MRVQFPTRNDIGVRDLSKSVTLGYFFDAYRGPAEPAARAAMNPVSLGALPTPPPNAGEHLIASPGIFGPFSTSAPSSAPPAPPVSAQATPTPQVTVPQLPPPTVIYVSSGGGTASPAPSTAAVSPSASTVNVVPASASVTDQVAGWLSGSTLIGSWNVPNALLAGGVALGVALLMGRKRR